MEMSSRKDGIERIKSAVSRFRKIPYPIQAHNTQQTMRKNPKENSQILSLSARIEATSTAAITKLTIEKMNQKRPGIL
jgi:hypothetical protein